MKTLRTIILSALTGALAAMFVERVFERKTSAPVVKSEPVKTETKPESSASRTIEDLSPTFKSRRPRMIDYDDEEIALYIDSVAMEMVKPGMTELEAERVGVQLSELARDALGYNNSKKRRERIDKERADQWLSDIDENGTGIDDEGDYDETRE